MLFSSTWSVNGKFFNILNIVGYNFALILILLNAGMLRYAVQ